MKMKVSSGFLFLAMLASPVLRAQPSLPPYVQSANNSADYSTTIAQGSIFTVFGRNLGPTTLVEVSTFPLQNILAGTSVTVSSGSTTLNCPMIFTINSQVAAILPSNTPVGQVTITVSYNAQTDSGGLSTTQATVVANSPAVYTPSESGLGAGSLTDQNYNLLTFKNSAKPGDTVTAWGTGLGPISAPDNIAPPVLNFQNVQVWVGGQSAKVVYAGRGCCAGEDQISFTVPAVGNGCNVPVTVVSGGNSSNTVTMPVSASGGACSDTGPTLPTSILSTAIAGQQVKVALLGIGPAVIGRSIGNTRAVADRLSAALQTPVSTADAAKIMRAYSAHNSRAIRTAMAKYAAQWKRLDARTKARLSAEIAQTQDGVVAQFGTLNNEGEVAALGSAQLPAAGSCVILPNSFPSGHPLLAGADAGTSLSLTGAGGALTLNQSGPGTYRAYFGPSVSTQEIPLGAYTISGTGGQDARAFIVTLTVASHLAISSPSALATVDRTQPLTVTWTGGISGNYVLIGGEAPYYVSATGYVPPSYFACAEDGGKGTFTIPAYILSSMNPTASGKGGLVLSPHPFGNQIAIPGIDLAYFIDGSSSTMNVTFK
jgi:uncharacterized protein (TIGR03437 family)